MIKGLNHVTLAVSNVERSFLFYRETLGFNPLCKWPSGAYFLVGDLWFCLNKDEHCAPRADYTHVAFSVSHTDFTQTVERLLAAGVVSFKANSSEGDSFYFLDPDGHKLEIHVGDWQSRLAAKMKDPWPGAEFFI
jgi:catechol 2,3-dioxygenase-like lactoylglutathione lyase family enzyme